MKNEVRIILLSLALIGIILATSCASSKTPNITTNSLPEGTEGVAYSHILEVNGGSPPYIWSVTGGKLPIGLQLNPTTGVISGTPMIATNPAFVTFMVTDKLKKIAFKQILMTVNTNIVTATTPFNNGNSASAKSVNGLELFLSLDSKTYQSGQQVGIYIDETNTLSKTNTITSSANWPVSGLGVGPCGVLNYPFGIAIFQGSYTAANISSGTPLQIYEPAIYHCPMTLADISSYVFQPLSHNAAVFQMSESTAVFNDMEMNTEFEPAPTGHWASNEAGSTFTNFEAGVYTIVAGDEWGNLVILHFTVN
jgi:Putative Ig domain